MLVNSGQRYFNSILIFLFTVALFSACTTKDYSSSQSASPTWKDEKLEMKRFTKVKLAEDFDEPSEIAVTDEGKVILIERKGGIKLYSPHTNTIKQLGNLTVYSGQEDGLLGVALDPQHMRNGYVYFYYSPTGEKPMQRVSRFTLQGDSLLLNSEKVLIEIPTQRQECCHSAGSLAFGPDGNLFIAVGDNTNPHNPGYYNSIDERKGRENWDAQRTAGNTNDLRGKILRIHPEEDGSYTIPKGNLFAEGTENTRPEIYVMGCRNPYRISVDAKRGWLYWGDVGQNTVDNPKRGPVSYDEWNVAREAGFFGWPYFAGPNAAYADFDFATEKIGPFFDPQKPVNESVNNTGLTNLPPAKSALIWYSYDESPDFNYLGTGGKSPVAGPVYYSDHYEKKTNDTTKHLPAHYDGKFFIAEWMRDWINVVTLTPDGKVDSIERFMPDTKLNHPIDLEIGPDGVLYVLEYGTYWFAKNKDAGLYRIEYNRGNQAPIAVFKTDKSTGGFPLTVRFSSEGSYDPDSSALSYQWYFDKKEAQSKEANPTFTFERAGTYTVRLVVSDKEGKKGEKKLQIKAGNTEPEVVLAVDGNSSFYFNNTPIHYKLNIIDKEDGSLQSGEIKEQDVKVTLAYHTMGPDLTMVAQAHESSPVNLPGQALMEKSDCKSCHAMKEKSVGPSYVAIAERYKKEEATIKKLAEKVISGGSGVWGEYVMSAHPQLSIEQASDIVTYILSVNEQSEATRTVAPTGIIKPVKTNKGEAGGEYILSVSYQDKEAMGVGSNLVKKNFYFKSPKLKAINSNDDKAVAKLSEGVIRFAENGSWIMFKDVDLAVLSSVVYKVDPSQIGGRLSLHIDRPDGKELSSVEVGQAKKSQKTGADQKDTKWKEVSGKLLPQKGVYDIYIVYHDPKNAQSSMWTTLYLDWIEFRK
ncbi:PQQ-dependent sugar dehydrogenase [Rhodocytophaga aerolata]|uniref:PQQ-dependent sugar dehydrogenase n=1 Tax=Rhodocytophaga aerolata TaxID=455078 RepID=A0ABT8RH04_9BACT|nr:PQQ-dependent sugar dehydrogenase [Rhodocytophaga aerolata]MDO1451379.1 PQQ-dependent sugar dehydrogenase [Rhodocytophaga aerolata]